jgi:CRP-like cAMP-binding protein
MDIGQRLELLAATSPFDLLDPEEREALAEKVKVKRLKLGDTVFEGGDKGDAFYVIAAGRARVIGKDTAGAETTLNTLSKGEGFGQIALLTDQPRTATVRASDELVLLRLERKDFAALIKAHPDIRQILERSIDDVAVRDFLKRFTVLGAVPARVLRKLAGSLEAVSAAPDETIVRQGEADTRFFVVKSGTLKVVRRDDGAEAVLGHIGPGECFGELGARDGRVRTADVVAESECRLYALSREGFNAALESSPELRQRLERVASSYEERRSLPPPPIKKGEEPGPDEHEHPPGLLGAAWQRLLGRAAPAGERPLLPAWKRWLGLYPFIAQHDMTDCGAASLAMILRYYGSGMAVSRLRDLANKP